MLTRAGAGVLAGSVVLYAVAWVLGWPVLAAVAVAGLAAVVLGIGWILRPTDLQVERRLDDDRVARGDIVTMRLTVSNRARWTSPRTVSTDTVGRQRIAVALPRLHPRQSEVVTVTFPAARRGVFTVGPLRVGRSDPFGLVRRSRSHGGTSTLWVHPVTHPLPLLPTRRSPSLEGPMADTVPSGSITFHALREYVLGDDLRHIHWRSSAKLGTLMVRQHVDTSQPDTTVVLDTSPAAYDPAGFEEAVDAAASVLASVAYAGFPAQLITTGGTQAGDTSRAVAPAVFLDALAAVVPEASGSLALAIDRLSRRRGSGTLVVVSGAVDAADRARVAGLRSRYDRVLLIGMTKGITPEISRRSPGMIELRAGEANALADSWVRAGAA